MLATRLCAILVVLPLAVSGLSMLAPEDPCKQWYNRGNTCEEGKVCRLVKVQCVESPCEPQPQCVDVETAPKGGCEYGYAVIDASSNKVPCSGCPATTACVDDSKDCCWQAPDPPTWPPCFNCKIGEQCLPTLCAPGSLPSDCYTCVESTDPCAKCAKGEQCLPTPCAPDSLPSNCYACVEQPSNPCAAKLCFEGYTCEVRPIKGCSGPNCAVEGVCVPTSPCGGCKPGYHCERLIQCAPGPSDPPKPCTDVFQCVKSTPNPGLCPAVAPGTIGTCAEECSHDGNCAEDQKCCSNGCGHVCRSSVEPVPHPCSYSRCSRETECRLQENCEDGICSAGANCVPKKCDYGQPLVGSDIVALFCGGGPGRVVCPEGSSCNIDEAGRLSVCCPNKGVPIVERCPVGLPVVNAANIVLFCGDGKNSVKCPEGTFCNSETDVCCHQHVPEPSKCPSGDPEIKGVHCRGGKMCPDGSYCETHPADHYAVCCPKPPSPCESAECDDDEECEEVVYPCLFPPCLVGHRCVRPVPNLCDGFKCPQREECRVETIFCVTLPCPGPGPVCRPTNKFGSCPANLPIQRKPCSSKCTNDADCAGTLKCCGGCTRECTVAAPPLPKEKPGSCPKPKPGVVGPCIVRCGSDFQCPGTLKCCGSCPRDCANPVHLPPKEKPGSCPKPIPGSIGPCFASCTFDSDCVGDLKCCGNCPRQCTAVTIPPIQPEYPCNLVDCSLGFECRLRHGPCSSNSCPVNAQCVPASLPPTKPRCRIGRPILDESNVEWDCGNNINSRHCPGDTVCNIKYGVCCFNDQTGPVPNLCNGFKCPQGEECRVETIFCVTLPCPGPGPVCRPTNKFGSCPANLPIQRKPCSSKCINDTDCAGTLKCCGVCTRECTVAAPPLPMEKPGSCPKPKPGIVGPCVVRCGSDFQCPGTLKCCGSCPRDCASPVHLPPKEKPGSCPKSIPGSIGPCFASCTFDSDCAGDLKCCGNCPRQCTAVTIPPIQPEYPCNLVDCFLGFECRLRHGPCSSNSCPVNAQCVPASLPPTKPRCRIGRPILDESNVEWDCGNNINSRHCPGDTVCNIKYGVCCFNDQTGPVPNLCNGFKCPQGEECRVETIFCVTLPCPGPGPVCRPTNKFGSCPANLPIQRKPCSSKCTNDADCAGTLKCCGGCTRECTVAAPPLPKEKPGSCPKPKPGVVGPCIVRCGSDFQCPGTLKCCGSCPRDCASPVHLPPKVKPGSCPKSIPGSIGPCFASCTFDSDCAGDLKCCGNCPRQCTAVTIPPIQPEYPCNLVDCFLGFECRLRHGPCSSKSCPVNAQCVLASLPPAKPRCRIGRPILDENNVEWDCGNNINSRPCPGDTVCNIKYGVCCFNDQTGPVPNLCDGFKCPQGEECRVETIFCVTLPCPGPGPVCRPTNKFGSCPANLPIQRKPCSSKCTNDADCAGTLKCCGGCTRECTVAAPPIPKEKPGSCPKPNGVIGICIARCTFDSDCIDDQKCCGSCPRECASPVHLPPKEKPGSCPKSIPGSIGPCFASCTFDSDCAGDLKCCGNCPRQCTAVTIPRVKPGFCPISHDSGSSICLMQCSDDYSCPRDSKCCISGCSRICKRLLLDAPYVDSDPCKRQKCGINQVCKLQKVVCKRAPCYPTAICLVKSLEDSSSVCGAGYPVLDMNSKPLSCFRACPEGTSCVKRSCCWNKKVKTPATGSCPVVYGRLQHFRCRSYRRCQTDRTCPSGRKCCRVGRCGKCCVPVN